MRGANKTYTRQQDADKPGHDTGNVGIQITLWNRRQTSLLLSEGNIRETIPSQYLSRADSWSLWARRNGRAEESGMEVGGGLRGHARGIRARGRAGRGE